LRHVPRQPRDGINVSDTHPLVEAGTLVVGLTAIFVLIVVVLIFLIEIALYFVPAEKEAAFFGDWLPDDLVTVAPDDERLYETQLLVDRLAFHWADSPYEFRVEIDDSAAANAMALPGGLIIVTSGLLDQVESENELAFVLGHELGHYRNRDHLRALGRGVVLSLVFAVTTGSDVAQLGLRVGDLTLRSFSRRQEAAADEFGLALVYTHYGHVDEAWRLFERWDDGDESIIDVVTYLSTHPQPGDRIEELEALADREGWPLEGSVKGLSW
jgi:Zn-dependent protease with chaperone function